MALVASAVGMTAVKVPEDTVCVPEKSWVEIARVATGPRREVL